MGERISFGHARVRMQRLSDAKILHGWVEQITNEAVSVRVAESIEVHTGERFHFEAQGKRFVGMFFGSLVSTKGNLFNFELTSPLKTAPSSQDVRYKLEGLPGVFYRCAGEGEAPRAIDCHVVDISLEGVGLEAQGVVKQGEVVLIHIETPWGDFEASAEARYCKKSSGGFRVGLRFAGVDRLNKGIQLRLLESLGY